MRNETTPLLSLTIDGLAAILELRTDQVEGLLTSGEMPFFRIAGEVRILTSDVTDYITQSRSAANAETVTAVLMNHSAWRSHIQGAPAIPATLASTEQGTFGRLLADSLSETPQGENVVQFSPR